MIWCMGWMVELSSSKHISHIGHSSNIPAADHFIERFGSDLCSWVGIPEDHGTEPPPYYQTTEFLVEGAVDEDHQIQCPSLHHTKTSLGAYAIVPDQGNMDGTVCWCFGWWVCWVKSVGFEVSSLTLWWSQISSQLLNLPHRPQNRHLHSSLFP